MSATDTIRAMLDERGVEYRTHGMTDRMWFDVGDISWFVIEREDGGIAVEAALLTPEQAIEATLGRETCEVEKSWHGESEMVEYRCTACDEYMVVEVVKPDGAQSPNYCPNCGRAVRA